MLFRKVLFTLLASLLLCVPIQKINAQTQYAYRVSFTDKTGTTGSVAGASNFLSPRAISRRDRLKITVDSTDFPISMLYLDTVLKKTNGKLHTVSRWQNNCVLLITDTNNITNIRTLDFVKRVELVGMFLSPLHFFTPEKEKGKSVDYKQFAKRTSGGIGYYGDAYDQISLARGDTLHELGFRGKGKLIAVLDEGFLYVNTLVGFDSLNTSGRIIDTYNFVQDNNSVYQNSAHGTQVLSTMAGILKDSYVGTAPDADYALYISEYNGAEQPFEMDNMVAAMERADSIGADVITISLGYNYFDIGGLDASLSLSDIDGKSTPVARAANMATEKGILVVASAGNDGGSAWGKVLTPGDADSTLTCGSVNASKSLSSTSGRGPNAAGVLKPDVCMLGAPGIVFNNSGTTSAVNGTSIATPELAGLAACLMQAFPLLRPYEIRKAIKDSAHIAANPNNDLGYGVPNFAKSYRALSPKIACICATGLEIGPNPFTDKLNISFFTGLSGNLNWELYNSQGQSVLKGNIQNVFSPYSFDINTPQNLAKGIYILKLQSSSDRHIIKLEH